jgi:hypothetical protein
VSDLRRFRQLPRTEGRWGDGKDSGVVGRNDFGSLAAVAAWCSGTGETSTKPSSQKTRHWKSWVGMLDIRYREVGTNNASFAFCTGPGGCFREVVRHDNKGLMLCRRMPWISSQFEIWRIGLGFSDSHRTGYLHIASKVHTHLKVSEKSMESPSGYLQVSERAAQNHRRRSSVPVLFGLN